MKTVIKHILISAIFIFMASSCIDKKYDWDNLDRNGVLKVPPVPLGSIDTIYLKGLPPPNDDWGIPLPDGSITLSDTIHGLFEGNSVKNFFFEGAGDVEISAKADIDLEIRGITIDFYFSIINNENERIKEVVMPKLSLTTGRNQLFSIIVADEYMQHMENAKDLQITMVLSSDDASIWVGPDDYIYIKEAIVKTGGFHYDL